MSLFVFIVLHVIEITAHASAFTDNTIVKIVVAQYARQRGALTFARFHLRSTAKY